MTRRWKCICAYDGGGYAGWQSQPGGTAIQDAIEARLAEMFGGLVRIHGSGRTDAGVHALGQVFHFDAAWRHGEAKLAAALGHGLGRAIQIVSVRAVSSDFHARFSAKGKVYTYHLFLGDPDPFTRPYCWAVDWPVDVEKMRAAAALLEGKHDFRAFSAANGAEDGEAADTVRHLRRLAVTRSGRRVRIVAEADGFLYKMVRRLVGGVVAVGSGKMQSQRMADFLGSGERSALIQTAPAQGLFLTRVLYR